jgi:hypothetical protein
MRRRKDMYSIAIYGEMGWMEVFSGVLDGYPQPR